MSFSSFKFHQTIQNGITDLGYTTPTPIQEAAIPPALEGRDVLACAATGSGKTAAFVLPLLHHILAKPRGTTRALILTPTRELALQIHEQIELLGKHTAITSAAIIGGVGMGPQQQALRRRVDFLVATPGRLLDHLSDPRITLEGIEHLVLDEADRMLDMGFLPDIRRVMRKVPARRQTLFFSATMPGPIAELTRELLRNPASIQLFRKAAPAAGVAQSVYAVAQDRKTALLIALLEKGDINEALVFTRTKHRANRVAQQLSRAGIKAERIHGDRSQSQRVAALEGFKSGKYRVLVATDIAARGIDIDALGHVVNYDVPKVAEDYIHRVGRTARMEAKGDAFTFYSPDEAADLRDIEKAIGKALPRKTVDDFDYRSQPKPAVAPSRAAAGLEQLQERRGRSSRRRGYSRSA